MDLYGKNAILIIESFINEECKKLLASLNWLVTILFLASVRW